MGIRGQTIGDDGKVCGELVTGFAVLVLDRVVQPGRIYDIDIYIYYVVIIIVIV